MYANIQTLVLFSVFEMARAIIEEEQLQVVFFTGQ